MAVQMHVAFSSWIRGAGVFSGGPYNCAQGSLSTATNACMTALITKPNVNKLVSETKSRAQKGEIDDYTHLTNSTVYLFHGTRDTTVRSAVMDALHKYYLDFVPATNVVYKNNLAAGHTQPSDDPINKNACSATKQPWISDCKYDGAGESLSTIYGRLNPRTENPSSSNLLEFDQTKYAPKTGISLANTGYVYIPEACANKSVVCRVHISFHGCKQMVQSVGMDYVSNTGYNKWADTNNIIVLYPQTVTSSFSPFNPNGCWDWWGYNNNSKTYDTKTGVQMVFVKNMIEQLAGVVLK